ncbi:hypothetical protein NDU88_003946 [Pleurodeles waltl]|uniref:Uncharacterized protein n=1 Tax=Pleurodeles waltl TaxID=8319 RepID=A0AAV7RIW6_PLEWA|nr:hypothetical protein NDU88_003946 [Pleurodeles waltl]
MHGLHRTLGGLYNFAPVSSGTYMEWAASFGAVQLPLSSGSRWIGCSTVVPPLTVPAAHCNVRWLTAVRQC